MPTNTDTGEGSERRGAGRGEGEETEGELRCEMHEYQLSSVKVVMHCKHSSVKTRYADVEAGGHLQGQTQQGAPAETV